MVLMLTLLSGVAMAQNNTNSPYTRYGFGQLTDPGSANSKAMGGVAYGLRDKAQVNFANPASYSAVDSLTFIFDGGLALQNTNFSNGAVKLNARNSSVDYITMMFRASKWCGISMGLLPYSNVGYNFSEYQKNETDANNSTLVSYMGDGGLHQVYFGAGIKVLNNLSVGANMSYFWGDITRSRSQSFVLNTSANGLTTTTNTSISSYKLDLGLQYTQKIAEKQELTLGAVFSPGHDLPNETYVQDMLSSGTGSSASITTRDTAVVFSLPTTIGVGLTYKYDNRLTISADYMVQKWSEASYMSEKGVMCNRTRLSVGAEYQPNPLGRSYFSAVKYRVGAHYSKPYYKIDGVDAAKEYGVSFGFGLPLATSRSLINLTAQYVRTSGQMNNFLNENTLRICVGITFNEGWFFKSKVN